MTRTATVSMLIGLLLAALAGPAVGQEPYPPPPQVKVSTPGAVITVTGNDWGPGTTVTVTTTDGAQSSGVTTSQATVADDGTFETEVTAPETAGDFLVQVAGTDASGAERSETQLYAVSSTANAGDTVPLAEERGGVTPLHLMVAGLLVATGGLLIRRRVKA